MSRKPFPTSLAEPVAEWIEDNCRHGPGDIYGQRVRLTNEEFRFLEGAYSIDQVTGRRKIDEATYSRRKGARKTELAAWIVCVEARGPVRAWLDDRNKPTAGPVTDPWIVVAATTEDQGEDTIYGTFREMLRASEELEPFFDIGLEITHLRDRPGKIEVTQTKNHDAIDGGKPTFEVVEESHLWVVTLRRTYDTMRRNLRKRIASQPWILAVTTAYRKGQGSVAEVHHDRAMKAEAGTIPQGRFLFDHRQAAEHYNLEDPDELRDGLVEAAGDAFWCDIDGPMAEFADPNVKLEDSIRYFLNRPSVAKVSKWIDVVSWRDRAVQRPAPPKGSKIVIAFDGSYSRDSTGIMGCTLDGYLFPIGAWENPNPSIRGWRVPRAEVQARMTWAMAQWDVVELAPDPFTWVEEIEGWEERWGERVVRYETNQRKLFGPACTRFREATYEGTLSHSGDAAIARHVDNAVPKPTAFGDVITKDHPDSPRKIDLAVGAVIAYDRAMWHAQHQPLRTAPDVAFV